MRRPLFLQCYISMTSTDVFSTSHWTSVHNYFSPADFNSTPVMIPVQRIVHKVSYSCSETKSKTPVAHLESCKDVSTIEWLLRFHDWISSQILDKLS